MFEPMSTKKSPNPCYVCGEPIGLDVNKRITCSETCLNQWRRHEFLHASGCHGYELSGLKFPSQNPRSAHV